MNRKGASTVFLIFVLSFVGGFVFGQWRLQDSADVLVVYTRNAGYTISMRPDCNVEYAMESFRWISGRFKCAK